MKEYEKSIAAFNEAIELDPKNCNARVGRAAMFLQVMQFQRALEDCSFVIENGAKNRALICRGIAHAQLGLLEKAIADFTDAIQVGGADADAYYHRGWANGKNGRYDAAASDLTRAIELMPNNPCGYEMRAYVLQRLGNNSQANEDHAKAIALRDALIAPEPRKD